jgi:hypothetical protein
MKKSDGLGSFLIPRRPIKGMHYYSVFKDQPDLRRTIIMPLAANHVNTARAKCMMRAESKASRTHRLRDAG